MFSLTLLITKTALRCTVSKTSKFVTIPTSIPFFINSLSLLHGYHPNPATPKLQHTSKQEHTTNVVIE